MIPDLSTRIWPRSLQILGYLTLIAITYFIVGSFTVAMIIIPLVAFIILSDIVFCYPVYFDTCSKKTILVYSASRILTALKIPLMQKGSLILITGLYVFLLNSNEMMKCMPIQLGFILFMTCSLLSYDFGVFSLSPKKMVSILPNLVGVIALFMALSLLDDIRLRYFRENLGDAL